MTPSDPLAVLRDTFGFQDFRPGQREVVDAVLAGRDCIAVMPTGAGKSLTFQLPARILDGAVLVLSPLISLMKDQVDALRSLGFRAAEINSKSPTGQRMAKFAINLIDDGLVGQQVFAGEATRLAYMGEEAEEGRDAFLEKRPRDFSRFPWYF